MDTKTINRAGSKKQTDEGIEFYVLPETFKTDVCAGLDSTYVAKVCIQRGWLMPSSDGKSTRSERMWSRGKVTMRCYRFTPKVLSDEE